MLINVVSTRVFISMIIDSDRTIGHLGNCSQNIFSEDQFFVSALDKRSLKANFMQSSAY